MREKEVTVDEVFNVINPPKSPLSNPLLCRLFSRVSSACTRALTGHQMLLENTREDYQVIQLTLYHDL